MKEKIILRVLGIIEFIIILVINFYPTNNNSIVFNKEKINKVSNNNLSMMLETDYDSNQYELATSSEWPTEGYIFNAELSACKNGSQVAWDSDTNRVLVYAGSIDSCYIYFDKEPDITYLADYIQNTVYTGTDGDNDLYYHDGVGSYTNASEEAGDNSYRYSGADPDNYVCFGSDDEVCSVDNLYRIIGVFGDQVKIIKYDYASIDILGSNGDYYVSMPASNFNTYKGNLNTLFYFYWNNVNHTVAYNATGYYNVWSYSQLNTINLNTNFISYLNEINSKWNDMIETHTWIVGGNTLSNISMVSSKKNAYTNEIINPAEELTYNVKIGLMYVSDYYYAASPTYWSYAGYNSSNTTSDYRMAVDNNWIYMGWYDWTISRLSDYEYLAFFITNTGYVYNGNVYYREAGNGLGVRPTFYLNANVAYQEGDGSIDSPFRIYLPS